MTQNNKISLLQDYIESLENLKIELEKFSKGNKSFSLLPQILQNYIILNLDKEELLLLIRDNKINLENIYFAYSDLKNSLMEVKKILTDVILQGEFKKDDINIVKKWIKSIGEENFIEILLDNAKLDVILKLQELDVIDKSKILSQDLIKQKLLELKEKLYNEKDIEYQENIIKQIDELTKKYSKIFNFNKEKILIEVFGYDIIKEGVKCIGKKFFQINKHLFIDVSPDETEIFLFGFPDVGKTSFLSGLFHHLYKENKIKLNTNNQLIKDYFFYLTNLIEIKALPWQNMPNDFFNIPSKIKLNGQFKKYSFYEISGEFYLKNIVLKTNTHISKHLKDNLYNNVKNKRILIFFLPANAHEEKKFEIENKTLIFIQQLIYINKEKIPNNIKKIIFLISKADIIKKQNKLFVEYIIKKFPTIMTYYNMLKNKYNIDLNILEFSLGEFDDNNICYEYNDFWIKNIIKYIL